MELIQNTYIIYTIKIFLLKICITVPVCYKVNTLKASYPLHVPVVQLLIFCVLLTTKYMCIIGYLYI